MQKWWLCQGSQDTPACAKMVFSKYKNIYIEIKSFCITRRNILVTFFYYDLILAYFLYLIGNYNGSGLDTFYVCKVFFPSVLYNFLLEGSICLAWPLEEVIWWQSGCCLIIYCAGCSLRYWSLYKLFFYKPKAQPIVSKGELKY